MFLSAALDLKHKVFILHITTFSVDLGDEMHLSKRVYIAYLKADKAPTQVLSEYADFADVFSAKLAIELPKYTRINNHAIELV